MRSLTVSLSIRLYIDCCCDNYLILVNAGLYRAAPAHPIEGDCRPQFLNKVDHILRIFPLVKEPRGPFLLQ